jgi:hypothetical protein
MPIAVATAPPTPGWRSSTSTPPNPVASPSPAPSAKRLPPARRRGRRTPSPTSSTSSRATTGPGRPPRTPSSTASRQQRSGPSWTTRPNALWLLKSSIRDQATTPPHLAKPYPAPPSHHAPDQRTAPRARDRLAALPESSSDHKSPLSGRSTLKRRTIRLPRTREKGILKVQKPRGSEQPEATARTVGALALP